MEKKIIFLILRMLSSGGTDLPAKDQNIGAWKHGKNNAELSAALLTCDLKKK